jgi:hypothetical protein
MHRTHTSERQTIQPWNGSWARFTEYELEGGYIRPAANSKLKQYWLPPVSDSAGLQPYVALAEIVREGRYTVSGRALTVDTREKLLRWCQRFGLLGVLLQRVESVVFPRQIISTGLNNVTTAAQNRIDRTQGGWQQVLTIDVRPSTHSFASEPEPGVILHPLSSFELTRESIGDTWERFFPSYEVETFENSFAQKIAPEGTSDGARLDAAAILDQITAYPIPTSDAFFELYQEPVDEFLEAATQLTDAISTIARIKTLPHPDFGPQTDFALALNKLNGLAAAVRSRFDADDDGSLVEARIAPTLLASLALTALQDLLGGRQPRICQNPTCHRLYVSGAYQARYCSDRCRLTVNKRTYRQGLRETTRKRRVHGQAHPVTHSRTK